MNVKKFIFNKMTLFSVLFAAIYQIFMLGIYLGGYKYTSHHTEDATIVYVNNDGKFGNKIINELSDNMKFKEKRVSNVSTAKKYLKDHEAVLVIEIPKNYTKKLADGKTSQINYYVNSAGDSMSKSVGTAISSQVSTKLNETVTSKKMETIMVNLMLAANKDKIQNTIEATIAKNPAIATDTEKIETIKKSVTQEYTKQFSKQAKKLTTLNTVKNHTVDINSKSTDMNYLMAPMLSALAGFVGAMTASTLIFAKFDSEAKKKAKNKWQAFFSLQAVYLLISVGIAITSTIILVIINGVSNDAIPQLFGASLLNAFISFQILNVTNLLLGQLSILINIPLVLVQAITSGSIMSAPLMPPIYRFIREFLPIPSTYQLKLNILYNTNASFDPVLHLFIIGICALAIQILVVAVKYRKDHDLSSNNEMNLFNL